VVGPVARRYNVEHLMLRILHDTHIDFIKRWRLVTVLIVAFLVPAVGWIAVDGVRGGPSKMFNLGVEFTSGTAMQLKFAQAPDVADLRSSVNREIPGVEVQTFGAPNEIMIRAAQRSDTAGSSAESVSDALRRVLIAKYGQGAFTVGRTEAISPRVGDELARNAIIAMLISFVVTLLYLAWRFDTRLAIASVLANVHDIIATFAFIKYMQIEMTLFVVGGILTVIGYSLADKVVLFDRVRELLRQGAKRPLRETLNLAINQTLPRTIMTGSTVIACLLALIFLGGEVLRPFAMVLLFGILIGTFSSIYVAAPILLFIEKKWPRGEGETKGMKRALAEERRSERPDKQRPDTMAAR
jgi:preprotein translocase subunit SecF